eukprot:2490189-Rhodomonas_salina.1
MSCFDSPQKVRGTLQCRASTPILIHIPPRKLAAGPLNYSSELVTRAGSISTYDPLTRLYTISVPTGLDKSELWVWYSETGQHLNLIRHLRWTLLWVDPVCIMDVKDNDIHQWWTLHSSHPDPDGSGSYLYEGTLHECGWNRLHHFTSDHLHLLLDRLADAPERIELRGNEKDMGLEQERDIPPVLLDYWVDQGRQGQPVPWSISHSLQASTSRQPATRDRHPMYPITAPCASLLRNGSAIHSYSFQTNRYCVDVDTNAHLLVWGPLNNEALGRVIRTAPLIFIPKEFLPAQVYTHSGRWWACQGVRQAPA